MFDPAESIEMLSNWAKSAEKYWYNLPGSDEMGCYGTGYNGWGVQTNQKYLSAMATLSVRGPQDIADFARARALAALRYSLATHVSGDMQRTDGSRWGHTWISSLGIERMMFGVYLLDEFLTDADKAAMDRVLASEADWLTYNYKIEACQFNTHGPNKPESNLWNGSVCWRAAMHNPNHPNVELWKEKARCFLINSISVPEDIASVARNVGAANFFSNYALDHHAYLNVGYMAICVSNAAMLHFDMKARGFETPVELMHHQSDLWQVLRRFIFSDGRLCRIGGDTRVRYAYCQDYLLPSLLFAADALGETCARSLLNAQMQFIKTEYDHNGDGNFYSKRLGHIGLDNPQYYPRLESDRAGVLAMTLRYNELLGDAANSSDGDRESFETSVAADWSEPKYGAAMSRSSRRVASFSWHSKYYDNFAAMAMCTPPDDGHLAEWSRNLIGIVDVAHSPYVQRPEHRRCDVMSHRTDSFDGGFITCGEIAEGVCVEFAEGWRGNNLITHRLAFAALPDGQSCVGLQYCLPADSRIYIAESLGMNWNIPNDMFNDFSRTLYGEFGEKTLTSPAASDQLEPLNSRWANVDNRVGAVALYGADSLQLRRFSQPADGKYKSLRIERVGMAGRLGLSWLDAGQSLFDIGYMCISDADADETRKASEANSAAMLDLGSDMRGVCVTGCDGRSYKVVANFSSIAQSFDAGDGYKPLGSIDGELPAMSAAIYVK